MAITTAVWATAFIVCFIAFMICIVVSIVYWRSQPPNWKKRLLFTVALIPLTLAGIIRSSLAILQLLNIH